MGSNTLGAGVCIVSQSVKDRGMIDLSVLEKTGGYKVKVSLKGSADIIFSRYCGSPVMIAIPTGTDLAMLILKLTQSMHPPQQATCCNRDICSSSVDDILSTTDLDVSQYAALLKDLPDNKAPSSLQWKFLYSF
ncbi:hypothetical protein COCOBI_15-1550 [Coccomyxa sp. Obi]|nr:hypothetical protein COCOBI_15-1550 [Coccomyxa sp. Obi]